MTFDFLKEKLVSSETIIEQLEISKSTFDRWRNRDSKIGSVVADLQEGTIGMTKFPEPAIHVGGAARWTVSQVNGWLKENEQVRTRRGGNLNKPPVVNLNRNVLGAFVPGKAR